MRSSDQVKRGIFGSAQGRAQAVCSYQGAEVRRVRHQVPAPVLAVQLLVPNRKRRLVQQVPEKPEDDAKQQHVYATRVCECAVPW
jgi:hypothetical protein